MALLNRHNFLVWQLTTFPEPENLLLLPEGGPIGKKTASVLLIPGESYVFYLNQKDLISIGSTKISIVSDDRNIIIANVGDLAQVVLGPQQRQYVITMTTPGGLPEGYYRLRIATETPGLAYFSNRLWYRPSDFGEISALFSFANTRDLANIPYSLPALAGFRQQMRLKCNLSSIAPETEVESYREVTTGQQTAVSIKQDLAVVIDTGYCDLIGHEGWQTLLKHRDILINTKRYTLKSGYQIGEGHLKISRGNFELYQTEFSEVNRC